MTTPKNYVPKQLSYFLAAIVVGFVPAGSCLGQQQPIALPLGKTSGADAGGVLNLSIIRIGNLDVEVPLLLDTGSASLSIACGEILPKAACTDKGVDPMAVRGTNIRLTDTVIKSNFEKTVEHRQLAYAKLSMGTSGAHVETNTEVPFFIRFKESDRASGKTVRTRHKGVFGISPIDATEQRVGEATVLRAIDPGQGLRRGYILRPAVGKSGECADRFVKCDQLPMLQIGIVPGDEMKFLTSKVNRLAPRWPFATTDACLTIGKREFCKPTLFDTGSSKSIIAGKPTGTSTSLSMKQVVAVKGETFATFSFLPSKARRVVFDPQLPFNVIGIVYFANYAYLVDFERNEVGFERAK